MKPSWWVPPCWFFYITKGAVIPAPSYDPTPEEIRKVCELIQAGWTDDERLRRAGGCYIKPVFCMDKPHRIRGNHVSQSDLVGEDY